MKHQTRVLLLGTIMMAFPAQALPAEIPAKYRGTWGSSQGPCPKSVAEARDRDDLLSIMRRGYKAHETSCTLLSILKGGAATSEAFKFSCWSEGERSTFNELWYIKGGLLVRRGGEYGEGTFRRCDAVR
jgi:hypothetical protein